MHIAAVLGKSWGKLAEEVWPNEYKIKKLWARAVGSAIAKNTEPTRLIGKKLKVTVTSSAWMNELSFHKADIIEKLGKSLGKGVVKDILFKTGKVQSYKEKTQRPTPMPRELTEAEAIAIDNLAASVKDPTIKEAIKKALIKGHCLDEVESK